MKSLETPVFRRWFTAASGLVFLIYAIWGVTVSRRVGVEHIGIIVPAWWYAVAAIPPAIALAFALLVPTDHPAWRRRLFSNALVGFILLSLLHIPLIYRLYDFEHSRANRKAKQFSSP